MLALEMADFWLNGLFPILVTDSNKDIYGQTITVGATVKFVGIVTAMNLNDPHFGDIQVMPAHPGAATFISDVQTGMEPQSPNFPVSNSQLPSGPFGFHPSQLIVGA